MISANARYVTDDDSLIAMVFKGLFGRETSVRSKFVVVITRAHLFVSFGSGTKGIHNDILNLEANK